jgi:hypothetical protein
MVIDRRRLRKTYSFYRQRPLFVNDDLSSLSGATSGSTTVPVPYSDMNYQSFSMFLGTATSTGPSSSKDSIGMTFFDKSKINSTSGAPSYYFRAIFATNQLTSSAYVELYDYNGLVTGIPGPVIGTVLTSSTVVIGQAQADVTSIFSSLVGSGIFEARAWVQTTGSSETATIKSARIDIEWP